MVVARNAILVQPECSYIPRRCRQQWPGRRVEGAIDVGTLYSVHTSKPQACGGKRALLLIEEDLRVTIKGTPHTITHKHKKNPQSKSEG